ncbi:FAD-dependent monooxygenase [Streptomyces sp. NPDC058221]|uniref:FAD-dependent monooxygenase n=1 Tax=Streptomyces sp. NPDC058221 TaxID=3346388 RepID=UPI0036E979AE
MSRTVVIAGAGPVGLVLAGELALHGVESVVIERRTESTEDSQGMAIHGRTLQFLRRRGLGEDLAGQGMWAWPRTPFAFFWLDLETVGEQDYTFALPQWRTERLLEERAGALGVDIRRGQEIVDARQDANGVKVTVRRQDGETYEIEAAYLIGCDGPDSTVRELAGIDFTAAGQSYYGVLGDVTLADGASDQFDSGLLPGGIFGALPLQPGQLRLMTIQFDREPQGPDVPVTVDELRASIEQIAGEAPEIGTVHWLSRFGGRNRLAERYRNGRILLAGDSAHVQFISGSQGLNTGVQDAANLGWKLAATVQQRAPEGLLDTYESERRPVAERGRTHAMAQMALLNPLERMGPLRELFDELLAHGEVNRKLLQMATETRYGADAAQDAHPLLGAVLPDAELDTPTGPTSVAEVMSAGRWLLLDLGAGVSTALADELSDRVAVVTAAPVPEIDAALVLVRPDGHVAHVDSTGSEQDGLRGAVKAWFG